MRAADVTIGIATEHARQLGDPFVVCHDAHIGRRRPLVRTLLYNDVVVRSGCDLRQVCDRQDLMF